MKFSKVSNPLSRVRNRTRSVKITSTCAWIDKPCWTDSSREIFRQDWVWKNGRKKRFTLAGWQCRLSFIWCGSIHAGRDDRWSNVHGKSDDSMGLQDLGNSFFGNL